MDAKFQRKHNLYVKAQHSFVNITILNVHMFRIWVRYDGYRLVITQQHTRVSEVIHNWNETGTVSKLNLSATSLRSRINNELSCPLPLQDNYSKVFVRSPVYYRFFDSLHQSLRYNWESQYGEKCKEWVTKFQWLQNIHRLKHFGTIPTESYIHVLMEVVERSMMTKMYRCKGKWAY